MQPDTARALGRLSPQQRKIFQMLASGLTCKEIAQSLTISTKTVETHMCNAYIRTNLNRNALIGAISEGRLGDYTLRIGRWHEEFRRSLSPEANQRMVAILADMRDA